MQLFRSIDGNTDTHSAQAFAYTLPNQTILFAVIEGQGVDAFTTIRHIGLGLDDWFSQDQPILVLMVQVLERIKNNLNQMDSWSVLLGVFENQTMHLIKRNQTEAILYRHKKKLDLTNGLADSQVISGPVKPGDRFIFTNVRDSQIPEFIKGLLAADPSQIDDCVENFLQQTNYTDPIAVISLVEEGESEIPEEPVVSRRFTLPSFHFRSWMRFLRHNPKLVAIILVSLAVVTAAIVFGVKNFQKASQKKADFLLYSNQAKSALQQAKQQESNTDQAFNLLNQAKEAEKLARLVDPKNKDLSVLETQIAQENDRILKTFPIQNWQTFVNLNLIKQDFKTDRVADSLGRMLVLDQNQKSLIALEEKTKTPQILAGAFQMGDAQFADIDGNYGYVYSADRGVLKINLLPDIAANQRIQTIIKPDPYWGKIKDIYVFGDNVYLLDSIKNQVWKYQSTDLGYSTEIGYINPGQAYDFLAADRLRIDGSVWVLKPGAQILKFTGGNLDFYEPQGVTPELDTIDDF